MLTKGPDSDEWVQTVRFTSAVRESLISDFKFVKILLVHQKFSPRLRTCISGKMAFDLIIWGYQSNYESISANDIQPGHCAFFDFENERDEETKSIQILKLKGKKFQLERQTLKSARKVTFLRFGGRYHSKWPPRLRTSRLKWDTTRELVFSTFLILD